MMSAKKLITTTMRIAGNALRNAGVASYFVPLADFLYYRLNLMPVPDCREMLIKNKISINKVYNLLEDGRSKEVYKKNIRKRLNKISDYSDIMEKPQYLIPELFNCDCHEKEIIIDAGAFDGDTAKVFIESLGDNVEKIYCFEADRNNSSLFKKNISKINEHNKIKLIPIALYNDDTELIFSNLSNSTSTVVDEATKDRRGIVKVEAIKLDSCALPYSNAVDYEMKNKLNINHDEVKIDERITFIKMDIEGAELKALEGAAETIKMYKPKLAICIYHNPRDLWEIPLYIKSLVPEYKLYVRHHSRSYGETVVYATI